MVVAAALTATSPDVYAGTLVTSTGPAFNAAPFPPLGSPGGSIGTITGTARFTFADANYAQFQYTVQLTGMPTAVTQTKRITRLLVDIAPGIDRCACPGP